MLIPCPDSIVHPRLRISNIPRAHIFVYVTIDVLIGQVGWDLLLARISLESRSASRGTVSPLIQR